MLVQLAAAFISGERPAHLALIGISGATGVTGEVTLQLLEERRFPVDHLRLFASRTATDSA